MPTFTRIGRLRPPARMSAPRRDRCIVRIARTETVVLEVEVKYRAADPAAVAAKVAPPSAELPAGGAGRGGLDLYFRAPDRDFERTDEAASRLRRIGARKRPYVQGAESGTRPRRRGPRSRCRWTTGTRPRPTPGAGCSACPLGYRPVTTVQEAAASPPPTPATDSHSKCASTMWSGVGRFVELGKSSQTRHSTRAAKAVLPADRGRPRVERGRDPLLPRHAALEAIREGIMTPVVTTIGRGAGRGRRAPAAAG